MTWHDSLALLLFIAAAIVVARRAYAAVFGGGSQGGCGSGCGSCPSNKSIAPATPTLLTIGDSPIERIKRG